MTFQAQVLSTLTFYYVYAPLMFSIHKYKKDSSKSEAYGWKDFYNSYSLPPGNNWNPFALSIDSIKPIILLLLNSK
jgi:hypothetical protein